MNAIKHIKSFVKRERQLGINKQKIFDDLWPKYRLDMNIGLIALEKIFDRKASLILEIGFGNGETIFSLAQKYPKQDFIGIEVYKPGVASLLALLHKQPLDNIKIYNEDAILVLEKCIPDNSLDKVLILFPDPWPKKRHNKRRLIQPDFVKLLQKKLKSQGILHIATDWEDYANHIETVLKNSPDFTIKTIPLSQKRPLTTRFEKRGERLGHHNFEFIFMKN
ncbi:MAG: tRNA (guanosine(46)-N7)-methyltransferase TrmB [Gammaproteobacteria bacterium]|nr:tRNA (guanosine(46)-N7)-methyltransferase TrmB [Gammaproteobacteria bacterium]